MFIILIIIAALIAMLFGGLYALGRLGQRVRAADDGLPDTWETFADLRVTPEYEVVQICERTLTALDDVIAKALFQLLPDAVDRDWFHARTGEYHLVGVA